MVNVVNKDSHNYNSDNKQPSEKNIKEIVSLLEYYDDIIMNNNDDNNNNNCKSDIELTNLDLNNVDNSSYPSLPVSKRSIYHSDNNDNKPKSTTSKGLLNIQESREVVEYNDNDDENDITNDYKDLNNERNEIIAFIQDWVYTILIGWLVVSYWRGTWLLLDIITCSQHPNAGLLNGESFCYTNNFQHPNRYTSAWKTYIIGYILLFIGITFIIYWQPPIEIITSINNNNNNVDDDDDDSKIVTATNPNNNNNNTNDNDKPPPIRIVQKITLYKAFIRFITIYILGLATVNIWHGIWYIIDYYIYTNNLLLSSWFSTIIGLLICYSMCAGASILAPPAIFLLDGPSRLPPPITVTIIDSYRGITKSVNDSTNNKKDPFLLWLLDIITSYIILPIGVVGYWRGCWYLMDIYLWDLTYSKYDLHMSILYSAIIGIGCLFVASEDIVQYFPTTINNNQLYTCICNQTFGRIRTLILAVGAVNFWRCFWLIWDEFIGKSNIWSGVISHMIGIIGLLLLGCTSCITAPPSTLGVDAVANEDCADEPLFHNVPIPSESIYLLAIGRQPNAILRGLPSEKPLLLLHEDYSTSSRFTQQSSSHIDRRKRTESYSGQILSNRNLNKRQANQFFRSR